MKYQSLLLAFVSTTASLNVAAQTDDTERPNIVFFLTEDLSPHYLKLFNNQEHGAATPNVEALSKQGYIYTNAYSNAPVSSAARTTLITGCYAPRFGGSAHRKIEALPMPEGLRMFPTYLREAGYFTCNAAKTDYNVILDRDAWDIMQGKLGDWRKRKDKTQPFFYQRNFVKTHESTLHFNEKTYQEKPTKNNPDSVYIHPYLPDTKLMRYTYATFYDRIKDSDDELGQLVQMLKEDGVLDNTFIFYFGDNGGSLPGTKGYTDDIGLHVPLVVYVPDKWKEKMPQALGTVNKSIVSFMDLGPTALNLAGVTIPKQMDGKPILGKNAVTNQDRTFCYGDRFDELYAFNRIMRKGNYRYARNYQPYHPQSLYALYRYKQMAFKEWKAYHEAGKLNTLQSSFFEDFGTEELYDLAKDPLEMHNLANEKQYKQVLHGLRSELDTYLVEQADLGFFPETIILEQGMENPDNFGNKNRTRIARFQQVANLQLTSFGKAKKELKQAVTANDCVEQWWGLTSCAFFGNDAKAFKVEATQLLKHERSFVQARAMVFLAHLGKQFTRKEILPILSQTKTTAEALLVLNDLAYLVEGGLLSPFELNEADIPFKSQMIAWRITYLKQLLKEKHASKDTTELLQF